MLGMLRSWLGLNANDDELNALRQENAQLKAVGGNPLAPTSGIFADGPKLGASKEQLNHYNGWVYSSIRPIAQRIAGQPIRLARKVRRSTARGLKDCPTWVKQSAPGRALELIESHPLLDALNDPNEVMVSWSLMYSVVAALQLTGKAYLWASDQPDGKLSLWPLPPSWVEPKNDGDRLFGAYVVRPRWSVDSFVIPGEDVARFYLPDPANPLGSVAPLAANGRAVVSDESIQEAQRKAFSNGVFPGVMLTIGRHPDVQGMPGQRPILTKVQREQITAAFKAFYRGVTQADEPLILDGMLEDCRPFTRSPQEMAFLESGDSTKARIAQGFGTNPLIMGEIHGANRAQAVVAEESFLSNTVNPLSTLISQVMTGWVALKYGPDLILWLEEARAKDTEQERLDTDQLIRARAITLDELRARHNLPPLPSGGDVLVSPTTATQQDGKNKRILLNGHHG
jgi:HK97 family phage portal protein